MKAITQSLSPQEWLRYILYHLQEGAHLKSLLTSLPAQDEHVIFLHGGDAISSDILSTIDKKAERLIKINETCWLWEYVKNQIGNKGAISPQLDGRMKALYP